MRANGIFEKSAAHVEVDEGEQWLAIRLRVKVNISARFDIGRLHTQIVPAVLTNTA